MLVVACVACEGELTRSGEVTLMDSGPRTDASTDAGPRIDAGRTDGGVTDTGPRIDAATPDAGPSDAGPPPEVPLPEMCAGGPLAEPIAGCRPMPVPNTGDPYADCVARINQFRAECQCLPPLMRWTEGEACADMQAEYDANGAGPHGGFRDNICSPRGNAQNECPGWGSVNQVISGCLQVMWDEGPGEPFSEHGHYINMSNTSFTRVACGFYETAGGSIWAVQNFR